MMLLRPIWQIALINLATRGENFGRQKLRHDEQTPDVHFHTGRLSQQSKLPQCHFQRLDKLKSYFTRKFNDALSHLREYFFALTIKMQTSEIKRTKPKLHPLFNLSNTNKYIFFKAIQLKICQSLSKTHQQLEPKMRRSII